MALIQVTVIAGVFTAPQKQEIVERLTDAMVAIEGENMRRTIWCIVEEVASGAWASAAGRSQQTTSRRSPEPRAIARVMRTPMTCEVETSTARSLDPRGAVRPSRTSRRACSTRNACRITSIGSTARRGRSADPDTTQRISCRRTLANVLKRPRLLRDDNEIGYLIER